MSRIAVVGAAGYVGLELCKELTHRGHEVVGITRANGRFLLDRIGVPVELPSNAARVGEVDAVINLAYPNSGSNLDYPRQNRELRTMIQTLAGRRARIVHVSTQAVFGFGLEHRIVPAAVRPHRDHVYVESKIELENLLLSSLRGRDLQIVRLGNVWGPASPTWTLALTDKILFGDPIGIGGVDGFCNATDVANVASYLTFLVEAEFCGEPARFHHLAEFSETRWSFWIKRIAHTLGINPVYADCEVPKSQTLRGELSSALRQHSPLVAAKQLYQSRVAGSILRSVVRSLPNGAVNRLKVLRRGGSDASPAGGQSVDPVFLSIMAVDKCFASHTDLGWKPKVDRSESWSRVEQWITEAGYLSKTTAAV